MRTQVLHDGVEPYSAASGKPVVAKDRPSVRTIPLRHDEVTASVGLAWTRSCATTTIEFVRGAIRTSDVSLYSTRWRGPLAKCCQDHGGAEGTRPLTPTLPVRPGARLSEIPPGQRACTVTSRDSQIAGWQGDGARRGRGGEEIWLRSTTSLPSPTLLATPRSDGSPPEGAFAEAGCY